jgi:hypothetical protein
VHVISHSDESCTLPRGPWAWAFGTRQVSQPRTCRTINSGAISSFFAMEHQAGWGERGLTELCSFCDLPERRLNQAARRRTLRVRGADRWLLALMVDWLCSRQEKHTMCASQKFKWEIPTKEEGEGHFDSRAFARC